MKDFGMVDVRLDSSNDTPYFEPKSPRKAVHFADSKGLALTSTYFFATENLHSCPNPKGDSQHENNRRTELQKGVKVIGKDTSKFLNFRPYPSTASLQETLEKQNVCLEQIMFCDSGICGRVQVRNLAYEKRVFVRYTFDAWLTYIDEGTSFVLGSSTGFMDTFTFQIKFPENSSRKRMEFALGYRVGGKEFWDNNYGDNYRLMLV